MKRYPKYKDSGAPWLGQVPAHWVVVKLSRVIDSRRPITYGIVQAGEDYPGGIKYIRPVDMTESSGVKDETTLKTTSPQIALQYKRSEVKAGDVVFSIGPSYGKVMLVPPSLEGANLTQGTARLAVSSSVSKEFLFHALRSSASKAQWDVSVGGATFGGLNLKPLSRTMLALPPLSEQVRIAGFLDGITSKLDDAILSQERMIELLKERRSAIITQAVTKGLDPKAKMKDSGVPWLGQVPAHWAIVPAYVLAPTTRRSISVEALRKKRVAHFSIPNVQDHGTAVIEDGDTIDSGKMLVEGLSVLVSRLNPRKRTVAIADVFSDADVTVCSGEFVMFRPKSQSVSKLLSLFFVSNPVAAFIESLVASTTKSHGRADPHVIKRMQVAVPPRDELEQIVGSISQQITEIDSVISSQIQMISLLKERRSSVVTQAVTGQIDVR